ncbi:MAG: hypothetical protein WC631_01165 [Candidatus Paceibacterota bacterium]|jgi:hypothetical protein
MTKGKQIIDKFAEGDFPGANCKPKRITTAISNLFLCNDKVYKIYMDDSAFFNKDFNDLSIKENRLSFTRNDFEWNNKLSPEIYTDLRGVVLEDGKIKFTEADDIADEFVIVMNKIDMSYSLIERLLKNSISMQDCYSIGFELGKREASLPKIKINKSLYEDQETRLVDMTAWVKAAGKYFEKGECDKYLNKLSEYIKQNKNWFIENNNLVGPCLDIHADNAVLDKDGTFLPLDTYAPKIDWLTGYKFLNVYRIAADIYVFLGKRYFDEVLRGYEKSTNNKIPRGLDNYFILYCQLIVCPYQYMLSENNQSRLAIAKKYHSFLKEINKLS